MSKNFPVAVDSFGVNRYDDALAAEYFGSFPDKFWTIDRAGIDGNFVGPGLEQVPDVFELVDSSSHCERHENLIGGARYNIENGLPVFVGSRNVEKAELVCAFSIIHAGNLNRITCIAKLEKFYTLDHTSGFYVKTRYDSFCEHGYSDE